MARVLVRGYRRVPAPPPRMMPRTFYDVKRTDTGVSLAVMCFSGARGAFLLRARSGEQKRAEQTRALTSVLSLTSVAVSVAISALVATARVTRFTCAVGDGMGEGLSQNDARVLRSAAHAFAGARGRRRAHSPRPSARHGGTRRPYRAQPGGSLWMGGYQRGCISQSVYESLESAVASGCNDVTPTVRSAGDWTSERKTEQKIGNARRRTHRTWRGRRRTRKWAPGRAWRQPAFSLDRRGTRGVLRADGIWFFGAVPHPVFFEGEGKKLDNPVQLACSIISEPLARVPRGLAASQSGVR